MGKEGLTKWGEEEEAKRGEARKAEKPPKK